MRRLVEAELLFQFLDEFRVQPLRAAILRGGGIHAAAGNGGPAGKVAALPGNTGGGGHVIAGKLRDHPLHRTAGGELHHHEGHQHDAEDGGHHEGDAAEDVGEHLVSGCSGGGRVSPCGSTKYREYP